MRLTDLRETANALRVVPNDSDVIEGALARYLVVRSAGYLEAVRDDVADTYVTQTVSSQVARRVRTHLRTGVGVAPSQLLDFVRSFHPEWHEDLQVLLDEDDQRLRSDLGALVAARKKIAHGDGESVTVGKALRWASAAEEVGKWLVRRFDPSRLAGDRD